MLNVVVQFFETYTENKANYFLALRHDQTAAKSSQFGHSDFKTRNSAVTERPRDASCH